MDEFSLTLKRQGKIIGKSDTMPIFFQQDIDDSTKLAIWKIEEEEDFFLRKVSLQRTITHPHKRLQHLAGRYILKELFPNFPVELIEIADTRKPYLPDETFHFSISHCDNYAAAIVSRNKRVGIDVEVPTAKVERIKSKFLHREELGAFESNRIEEEESSRRLTELTLLWSAKEAVFKWWSYGAVDFSEMIRLEPCAINAAGQIDCRFITEERVFPLTVHYRLFDALSLAWVAM